MKPISKPRERRARGGRLLRLAGGLAVSGVAIAWLANKVDLDGLRRALADLSWPYIPLLALLYLAGFTIRGYRWQLMLRPVLPLRWGLSTALVMVGYAANNVLPARLGEVVRALGLTRTKGVSVVTAFTSIAVERVFDGLTLVGIFAVTLALAPNVDPMLAQAGLWAGLFFLVALLGVVFVRVFPVRTERLVEWVASRVPPWLGTRLRDLTQRVSEAVAFLDLDLRMGLILLTSLAIWLCEGSVYWVALVAMGLPPSAHLAYFTLAVTGVGVLLPSAPGYVGIIQACAVISFAAFGIASEQALAYSIVLHTVQYFPVTILGLIFALRMGLSVGALRQGAPEPGAF